MTWGIDIDVILVFIGKAGFLGEDRDAFFSFVFVVIEEGIFMIDPAKAADRTAFEKDRFGKCRLSSIDMGIGADDQ